MIEEYKCFGVDGKEMHVREYPSFIELHISCSVGDAETRAKNVVLIDKSDLGDLIDLLKATKTRTNS